MRTDLDACFSYGRGRLHRLRHSISQIGYAAAPPVRITVLSGMHADTRIDLNTLEFTIGPDTDDDVMLLDQALRDGPIKVKVTGTVMGPMIAVTSGRSDVSVGNDMLADHMGSERLPCVISVNGLLLRIAPILPSGISKGRRFGIAVAACSLAALVLMGLQVDSRAAASSRLTLPAITTAAMSEQDAPQQRERIEAEILSAGLEDYLTVERGGGRTVIVSGSLPREKMNQWQRIRQDVDAKLNGVVLLANIRSTATLSNLPAVSAAKLGDAPTLVLFDGRELGLGDTLSGQWVIDEITPEGFSISRQGETATLSF